MRNYFKTVIFCLLLFGCKTKAQKVETYKFVVKDKIITDTVTKIYVNAEFEFSYKRIINGDRTFKEQGLFERGESFITFKKKGQDWYVKNNGKWELFYASRTSVSPSLIINGNNTKLILDKTMLLYGLDCKIYKVSYPDKEVGGNMYYGFNPEKGIIYLKSDDVELIRKDILPQK